MQLRSVLKDPGALCMAHALIRLARRGHTHVAVKDVLAEAARTDPKEARRMLEVAVKAGKENDIMEIGENAHRLAAEN